VSNAENSGQVQRWADASMYRAEPMPDGGKMTVKLLTATHDPLGVLAAICGMYSGRVTRNLGEVTDEQRRAALDDMLKTTLNGPLSSVTFVFLIEGVDRSLTHQAVRQQHAFFAQESLRFAVKEDWSEDVPFPPHLAGMKEDDPQVRIWEKTLTTIEDAYSALVHAGMPAEEARGLLPEAILTRYYWVTNLKGLFIEAGKRTCTQAQFHWRRLFALVAQAIREYGRNEGGQYWYTTEDLVPGSRWYGGAQSAQWQYDLIASKLAPNCYQTGSCGFMAAFDRGCTIRERVELNAKAGRPPSVWHWPHRGCSEDPRCDNPECDQAVTLIPAIDPREWAADPGAART
jgi:flavin-dependent thymidylate synthase